jgi:hypothetical protein
LIQDVKPIAKLVELPSAIEEEIVGNIAPYTVSIGRVINGNTNRYQLLGSGTLIQVGARRGILTAYHCLHACNPEARMGIPCKELFIFMLKRGRAVLVRGEELFEQAVGVPLTEEYGPDLTFIELRGDPLSWVNAIGSFAPLERDIEDLERDFLFQNACLVVPGFAEEDQEVKIKGSNIYHDGKLMGYFAALKRGAHYRRKNWDYVIIRGTYSKSNQLPRSFGGVSGAGVWSVRVGRRRDRTIKIDNYALVGVIFYQTPRKRNSRSIRGHYARSLYDRTWKHSAVQVLG